MNWVRKHESQNDYFGIAMKKIAKNFAEILREH